MQRGWVILISIALAALAWLALDDITTGSQPGFALEWTAVAVAAAWFAWLGWRRVARG